MKLDRLNSRVAAISLAALGLAFAAPAPALAAPKGSVVVASSILAQNADPTATVSTADYMISEMIFDGLINLNEKGKVPGLAESWVVSPDGKQIDFKLRKNVRFHDGAPFTADDVVFSLKRVPGVPNSPSSFATFTKPIVDVKVVDPTCSE